SDRFPAARRRARPARSPPRPGRRATSSSRSSGPDRRRAARSGGRAPRAAAAPAGCSGSAPASPAGRRASGPRSAARTPRYGGRRSEPPLPVLLDELAVALDPAVGAQVLDHVPVERAHVRAADEGEPVADREVHGPVDLLVEERVLRVALDAAVAADPELAEHGRALVDREGRVQERLVRPGRALDDAPAAEDEPYARHLVAVVARGVLGERHDALGRVLDGAVEDLAARHVRVGGRDLPLPAAQAERQVGAVADDPDAVGPVEALGDPSHLSLGLAPVDEDRAEEE